MWLIRLTRLVLWLKEVWFKSWRKVLSYLKKETLSFTLPFLKSLNGQKKKAHVNDHWNRYKWSIVCQRLIVIILMQKVSNNDYQIPLTPLTQIPKFLLETVSTWSKLFIYGVYIKRFSETNVAYACKHGNANLVFVSLKLVL